MERDSSDISVVIPAYNEGGRIGPTIRQIAAFLGDMGLSFEIICVDDGSSDGTVDVVRHLTGEVPNLVLLRHSRNLGKGMAVKTGFLTSRGKVVLFTDADHSTSIGELPGFLSYINEGYDIVIGSRALPQSVITRRQPWHREKMGKVFNLLVRLLVLRGFRDTQCGFKCFRRRRCLPVFERQRIQGFSFDVELLYLAKRMGLRIAEVPVTWRNSPDTRVGVLKDSLRMLRDLLKIRLRVLLGRYRMGKRTGLGAVSSRDTKGGGETP